MSGMRRAIIGTVVSFGLAAVAWEAFARIGMLMGRFRSVERFVVPLVSVLSPIPSLAWVPLFILWFGLGNTASVALVFYAALFPLVLNTWTGVCSVNRLWIRAAESMGATRAAVFR